MDIIVSLIQTLVDSLCEAEASFYEDPKSFYTYESSVKASAESFAAGFLSASLSAMDRKICESGIRKNKYTIARHDSRTLLTTVGEVMFDCTYFRSREDAKHHYLLAELMDVDPHERFSEAAEAQLLRSAVKTSYEDATRSIPSESGISKTCVMNKIHGIAEQLPCLPPKERKSCPYLFIEADEDHVAEQHGRSKTENKGFESYLAYIYEYKQETKCKGRRELVGTYYFSGLYPGGDGTRKFWEEIQSHIEMNYDTDALKRVYISGDGAAWIRSGTQYIYRSWYCVDKYHMSKYIHAAANQMLDEKEQAEQKLYHLIMKKDRKGFKKYTEKMACSANNVKTIEDLQKYALGNWAAVMRSYHDELLSGCCAEGHVSSMLSARLSSRPMGWSQIGADRMSKLRCYVKNHGEDKIIELVRHSREKRCLKRTGTEDSEIRSISVNEILKSHRDNARVYLERIQATIPGTTVRKTVAIRNQMHLI